MKYLADMPIDDRIRLSKKKGKKSATQIHSRRITSRTIIPTLTLANTLCISTNRGGVDEGSEMWLRRIFSIGEDDLSSRTFHRNIEYDKIISRHPSLLLPPPFAHRPERSPFCGSVGNGRA